MEHSSYISAVMISFLPGRREIARTLLRGGRIAGIRMKYTSWCWGDRFDQLVHCDSATRARENSLENVFASLEDECLLDSANVSIERSFQRIGCKPGLDRKLSLLAIGCPRITPHPDAAIPKQESSIMECPYSVLGRVIMRICIQSHHRFS